MTPSEFSEAIKAPDVFLLDVRPLEDFEKVHIPGAHHIDVTDPNFAEEVKAVLPAGDKIAVYCNTGKRSAHAKEILDQLGYDVLNLDNGITSWIAAKYPTT